MKTFFLVLFGLGLIGSDVWLYYRAETNGGIFLLLFGIGSAIAVPLGVGLITYALGEKQREAIRKLTSIPEIGELIEKADTQEQKIAILRKEYDKLQATIQSESVRLSLKTRKDDLEKDANRIFEELDYIEGELTHFSEDEIAGVPTAEVNKLRERIRAKRKGDIVIRIGKSQFVFEREQILHTPVFGYGLYMMLKLWEEVGIVLGRSRIGQKRG